MFVPYGVYSHLFFESAKKWHLWQICVFTMISECLVAASRNHHMNLRTTVCSYVKIHLYFHHHLYLDIDANVQILKKKIIAIPNTSRMWNFVLFRPPKIFHSHFQKISNSFIHLLTVFGFLLSEFNLRKFINSAFL